MYNYDDLLRVGVFTSTHGVKGEIKVFPTTDDNERFKKLKTVLLDTKGNSEGLLELSIENVKFFKNMVILKFKEINNINDIELYRGRDLLISRDQAIPLKDDEFFVYDAIGSDVMAQGGIKIGILTEILETPANNVFVIKLSEDVNKLSPEILGGKMIKAGTELLLPSGAGFVKTVDTSSKVVTVDVPKGIL